jgi:hypothetical protein
MLGVHFPWGISVRVSVARDKVFLEVSAVDAAGAEATVQRLPMSKWWDLDIYQVNAPVGDLGSTRD